MTAGRLSLLSKRISKSSGVTVFGDMAAGQRLLVTSQCRYLEYRALFSYFPLIEHIQHGLLDQDSDGDGAWSSEWLGGRNAEDGTEDGRAVWLTAPIPRIGL